MQPPILKYGTDKLSDLLAVRQVLHSAASTLSRHPEC